LIPISSRGSNESSPIISRLKGKVGRVSVRAQVNKPISSSELAESRADIGHVVAAAHLGVEAQLAAQVADQVAAVSEE
jgi:hypothetical protein